MTTKPPGSRVRDRVWLWGHPAGAHDRQWNTPRPSRMTPTEAAYYMGIPGVVMVHYDNKPEPPLDQYGKALAPLDRVVWSIVGEAGKTSDTMRDTVLGLAARHENVSGVIMDDFFKMATAEGPLAALSVEQLAATKNRLASAGFGGRKLDLWVVLYDHQLDMPVRDHLNLVDVVTLWTWEAKNLPSLERHFDHARKLAPHARFVLGCYMWDYGAKPCKPIPDDVMAMQCETSLRWLREKRIEGVIFLASCICDLDLPAVEYTRNWLKRVGDQPLA